MYGLVAIIDAPRLEDIEITLSDGPIFWLPKLCKFIDRIEMHKSHSRAHILFSEDAISISLMHPGTPTCLKLELFCKSSSVQLYFMARICVDFSVFLLNVRVLRISATKPEWIERVPLERWLEILNSFSGVMCLQIDPEYLTSVVHALLLLERRPQHVLPALHKLYIPRFKHHAPVRMFVESLIASRSISGHHIRVEFVESGVLGTHVAVPCSTTR